MPTSNDDRSRSMNSQDTVGQDAAANHDAQVESNKDTVLSSKDDSKD